MTPAAIVLLGLGLALDGAAVAAAIGVASARAPSSEPLRIAGVFGAAHVAAVTAGWVAGDAVGAALDRWDHWIAGAVLGVIGGRMLFESWKGAPADREEGGLGRLLVLAAATSIDAAAVGVTLPLLDVAFGWAALSIGGLAALFAGLGWRIGRTAGARVGRGFEAVGGVVLVMLAVKVLLDHGAP